MTTEINKHEIIVKNCKNLSSRSPKLDLNRLSLISFVAFRPSDATFLFVCLKHKNCFALHIYNASSSASSVAERFLYFILYTPQCAGSVLMLSQDSLDIAAIWHNELS